MSSRRIAILAVVAAIGAWGLIGAWHLWRRTVTDSTESIQAVALPVDNGARPSRVEQRTEIPHTSDVDEVSAEPASPAALSDLNIRLGRDPDDIDALIDRGVTYIRLRDFDKSEADLASAVKLAPGDPRAWALYGYLQELRQRPDDAVAAYDKAISLGSKNVEILGNRAELRRKSKQYTDAIADWTTAIELLSEEAGSARERMLRNAFYHSRGSSWAALGQFDQALRDFEHLVELQPELPIPRVELARVHFTRQDYDQFTTCMMEAIRRNPGDAGKEYEPSSDRLLTAEALKHGEEQLRTMLNDRPALGTHLVPGDELWSWAVRKFAGEDTGILVDWNPSMPSRFEADSGTSRLNALHAQIRVINILPDSSPGQDDSFELMWIRVVFELHNVAASDVFRSISQQAIEGTISREQYILAKCSAEDTSKQRTRALYLKLFLPWMRSKKFTPGPFHEWFCLLFFRDDRAREAYWQRSPHWAYYSVSFDLLRARSEFGRGDYAQMTKHLDLVEARQGSLTSNQLANLRYWQDKAAHLRARDEQHNSKAKSENYLESLDTYPVAVPR